MTTRDTRRGEKMPTANPQSRRFDQGKRGSASDAAMERADAVTRRLDAALSAAIRGKLGSTCRYERI